MNTTKPQEYITLKSGESLNFAEIYDKKYRTLILDFLV